MLAHNVMNLLDLDLAVVLTRELLHHHVVDFLLDGDRALPHVVDQFRHRLHGLIPRRVHVFVGVRDRPQHLVGALDRGRLHELVVAVERRLRRADVRLHEDALPHGHARGRGEDGSLGLVLEALLVGGVLLGTTLAQLDTNWRTVVQCLATWQNKNLAHFAHVDTLMHCCTQL